MPSLYEITQDVMYLQELLENGDIDDKTYHDTVQGMCVDNKIENICKVMKNMEAKADAFKAEEDRMRARRKTLENGISRLKDSLMVYMLTTNNRKVEAGLFNVSMGMSKSVNVWAENMLPEEYLVHQPVKVDKVAITKALKEGVEVPGAELVEKAYLSVR